MRRSGTYSGVVRVTAFQRFRAWLMLATFVASLGSSSLNLDHLGIIDTACGDVGLSAGTDGAELASPSTPGPEHCPVCHFLRAVSGASAAAQARLAVQDGPTFEFAAATQVPHAVDPITRPSRGPPAATLTFFI
jgi:hypothetical protein